MKITIFADDYSQTVDAPDGILSWTMINPDGTKSERNVEIYEYRELSVHKFCYVALFRKADINELRNAAFKYGYDVN